MGCGVPGEQLTSLSLQSVQLNSDPCAPTAWQAWAQAAGTARGWPAGPAPGERGCRASPFLCPAPPALPRRVPVTLLRAWECGRAEAAWGALGTLGSWKEGTAFSPPLWLPWPLPQKSTTPLSRQALLSCGCCTQTVPSLSVPSRGCVCARFPSASSLTALGGPGTRCALPGVLAGCAGTGPPGRRGSPWTEPSLAGRPRRESSWEGPCSCGGARVVRSRWAQNWCQDHGIGPGTSSCGGEEQGEEGGWQ